MRSTGVVPGWLLRETDAAGANFLHGNDVGWGGAVGKTCENRLKPAIWAWEWKLARDLLCMEVLGDWLGLQPGR